MVGCVLAGVGLFFGVPAPFDLWFFYAGMTLVVPIGLAAGIVGAALAIRKFHLSCPNCGRTGKLVLYPERQYAVDCEDCGFVHTKNVFWSFKIVVTPHDSDDD